MPGSLECGIRLCGGYWAISCCFITLHLFAELFYIPSQTAWRAPRRYRWWAAAQSPVRRNGITQGACSARPWSDASKTLVYDSCESVDRDAGVTTPDFLRDFAAFHWVRRKGKHKIE